MFVFFSVMWKKIITQIMMPEDTMKTPYLLSTKNHSTIRPVKNVQELEVPINPVTFHSN